MFNILVLKETLEIAGQGQSDWTSNNATIGLSRLGWLKPSLAPEAKSHSWCVKEFWAPVSLAAMKLTGMEIIDYDFCTSHLPQRCPWKIKL